MTDMLDHQQLTSRALEVCLTHLIRAREACACPEDKRAMGVAIKAAREALRVAHPPKGADLTAIEAQELRARAIGWRNVDFLNLGDGVYHDVLSSLLRRRYIERLGSDLFITDAGLAAWRKGSTS